MRSLGRGARAAADASALQRARSSSLCISTCWADCCWRKLLRKRYASSGEASSLRVLRITSFGVVPASARGSRILAHRPRVVPDAHPEGGPVVLSRNPTTSFLTATTLIYAIGAGITAAAGTRLALQLILVKGFKFYSFQLQDMDALYCYFLSLPPCVRIG